MNDLLTKPWPWYISGPAITLIMLILLFNGKSFGFSSNLRTICSIAGAGRLNSFFRYDWKAGRWNLAFLIGSIAGGWLGGLATSPPLLIAASARAALQDLHINYDGNFLPSQLFGPEALSSPYMVTVLFIGGLLLGFGARYAGGCTSGHAITGLSNLQSMSLVAVCGFFIGGLIMTHLLFPLIF